MPPSLKVENNAKKSIISKCTLGAVAEMQQNKRLKMVGMPLCYMHARESTRRQKVKIKKVQQVQLTKHKYTKFFL
jgi:hypothetical protein